MPLFSLQHPSSSSESFKTWHGDGTEFENAFLPPTGGNICFGVWKDLDHGSVKLHHIGLMFDSMGRVSNIFTVDEKDTVASNGKTYSGTFDFKLWPPSFDAVGVGTSHRGGHGNNGRYPHHRRLTNSQPEKMHAPCRGEGDGTYIPRRSAARAHYEADACSALAAFGT